MNDKLRKCKFYNQISPKSEWKTYHNQTYEDYWNKKRNESMTNEEYIRTCSTEELEKLIYKIAVTDVLMDRFFTAEIVNAEIVDVDNGTKEAEAWLKEKHE